MFTIKFKIITSKILKIISINMEEEKSSTKISGKGTPYNRAQLTQLSLGTSDIDSAINDCSLSSSESQDQRVDNKNI